MAHAFGSPDWARALAEEINDSSEYRNAAAKWGVGFDGNLLFVFEADGGLPETKRLLIRLQAGRSDGVQFLDGQARAEVGFTLRAPFGLWKSILERRTLAATAILTGKLAVEGEKLTLLKHTAANRALIHCTASVDTDWSAVRP
jgi:putative sterol carrier protein